MDPALSRELQAQYRDLTIAWADAQSTPKVANRLYDQHHSLYKRIRESEEGRAAIVGLLNDPVLPVRLMAAAHSLAWAPEVAQQVLEDASKDSSLFGATAKYTLQSYRAGKLNLDW